MSLVQIPRDAFRQLLLEIVRRVLEQKKEDEEWVEVTPAVTPVEDCGDEETVFSSDDSTL